MNQSTNEPLATKLDMKKLDILSEEKAAMKSELIALMNAEIKVIFVFVTSFAAMVVAGFSKGIFTNPDLVLRKWLFLTLSQTTWFLALFLLAILSNISVHASYIKVLEEKINRIAGDTLCLWDHKISPDCLYSWRSSLFLHVFVVMIVYSLALLGYLFWESRDLLEGKVLWIGLGEVAVLLFLTGRLLIWSKDKNHEYGRRKVNLDDTTAS